MIYFKTCPKCRGDMHMQRDKYGSYRHCFQCGPIQDEPAHAPFHSHLPGTVHRAA